MASTEPATGSAARRIQDPSTRRLPGRIVDPLKGDMMELTIQDLGALGEFLGSVAVLVTFIYPALQTRQNTMAMR